MNLLGLAKERNDTKVRYCLAVGQKSREEKGR